MRFRIIINCRKKTHWLSCPGLDVGPFCQLCACVYKFRVGKVGMIGDFIEIFQLT